MVSHISYTHKELSATALSVNSVWKLIAVWSTHKPSKHSLLPKHWPHKSLSYPDWKPVFSPTQRPQSSIKAEPRWIPLQSDSASFGKSQDEKIKKLIKNKQIFTNLIQYTINY